METGYNLSFYQVKTIGYACFLCSRRWREAIDLFMLWKGTGSSHSDQSGQAVCRESSLVQTTGADLLIFFRPGFVSPESIAKSPLA